MKERPEDGEEDQEGGNGAEPQVAARLQGGLDEEEAGVGEPHPGPWVAGVVPIGVAMGIVLFFGVYASLRVLFESTEGDSGDAQHEQCKAEQASTNG